MEYKRNIWYRIGLILTVVSASVMIVTFVMMGMGFDGSIIWFFAACPVLVIGLLTAQSIKRKYEFACDTDGYPSRLTLMKEGFFRVGHSLSRRGAVGAALLISVVLFTAVSVVFLGMSAHTAFERGGALNAGYNYHKREYSRYSELKDEALERGNTVMAEEYSLNMEKELSESEECLKAAEKLTVKLSGRLKLSVIAVSVDIFFLTLYIVFVIHYNHNKQTGESSKKQRRQDG